MLRLAGQMIGQSINKKTKRKLRQRGGLIDRLIDWKAKKQRKTKRNLAEAAFGGGKRPECSMATSDGQIKKRRSKRPECSMAAVAIVPFWKILFWRKDTSHQ